MDHPVYKEYRGESNNPRDDEYMVVNNFHQSIRQTLDIILLFLPST
jgi:hypothetical protein